jgi:hypothetical protein
MAKLVPITRIGKFFGDDDFNLDIEIGMEYLDGDLNMIVVLYIFIILTFFYFH